MKRIAFIQGYSNSFSVGRMCHLLKVSRSHYYSVIHFEKSPDALTEKVVAIFSQHSKRYGSRRIIAELKEEHHISVGRQRIRRIMHEQNLQAIQPRSFVPKTTISDTSRLRSSNLLLEIEGITGVNQVWVGDITYLPTSNSGWLYLAVWQDLFSRYVVGWQVEEHMREALVISAFRKALMQRQPSQKLIVHSDGGTQYSSKGFRNEIKSFRQSMTRKDNHYDNATMESFFSRLKAELLEGGAFQSLSDARKECFSYIEEYYNRIRRHSALEYVSPLEFENQSLNSG